jgi:hypothetical protein
VIEARAKIKMMEVRILRVKRPLFIGNSPSKMGMLFFVIVDKTFRRTSQVYVCAACEGGNVCGLTIKGHRRDARLWTPLMKRVAFYTNFHGLSIVGKATRRELSAHASARGVSMILDTVSSAHLYSHT